MLNRLTVSALLKAVILMTALPFVGCFLLSAFNTWQRLQSGEPHRRRSPTPPPNLFKAMHNLRTDRTTTNREMTGDQPMIAEHQKYLRGICAVPKMPAIAAPRTAAVIDFAAAETLIPELDRLYQKLVGHHKEFSDRGRQAEGRSGARRSPRNIQRRHPALLDDARQLSRTFSPPPSTIRTPTIDQLLAIKQAAWLLRNTAGEASLAVCERACRWQDLAGGAAKLHQDSGWQRCRLEGAGTRRRRACNCLRSSPTAMAGAKAAYFDPKFLALTRPRGRRPGRGTEARDDPTDYVKPLAVGRLAAAVKVAEAALDAAKDHAAEQHTARACELLVVQLVLLFAGGRR